MHLTALMTIDTAFTLYMGKVMGSATDPSKFPTPQQLSDTTVKLLSKAERNFVEKAVDDNGVWKEVPAGKGSIWNIENNLAIASYCTEHLNDIKIAPSALPYAYNAVINSRKSTKQNPKLLMDIHIVPALLEGESISDFPHEVLQWIDLRCRFTLGPIIKYLKQLGVPIGTPEAFQATDWEELVTSTFATMDDQKDVPTDDRGGELNVFAEASASQINVDLMAMGGDEHVDLFASNFEGIYYLKDSEHVAEAQKAQKIMKGYWDLCHTASVDGDGYKAVQSIVNDMHKGIADFKTRMEGMEGAGIVILD